MPIWLKLQLTFGAWYFGGIVLQKLLSQRNEVFSVGVALLMCLICAVTHLDRRSNGKTEAV